MRRTLTHDELINEICFIILPGLCQWHTVNILLTVSMLRLSQDIWIIQRLSVDIFWEIVTRQFPL